MDPLPRFPRSAYGPLADRARDLLPRRQPDSRGWGQPCRTATHATFTVTRPDNVRFGRPFRKELAPLVQLLLQGATDLGYAPRRSDEPGGGFSTYNCRPIRDAAAHSWHSWPVAFDLNSRGNPRQRDANGWRSTQPPWFVTLMESAGFYWGGRYTNADPMHFEYLGWPADVAADLANAKRALDALKPPDDAVKPEDVLELQKALNAAGASPRLVEDGIFGPATKAAIVGLGPRFTALRLQAETASRLAAARGNSLHAVASDAEAVAVKARSAAS